MIEVSAGIIRREDGAILICQRGEGRHNAHLWEFPGGKREPDETAEACLIRELREELALPVGNVKRLCEREAEGIRFTFLTAETDAEPTLTEHEAALFVPARKMLNYPFCPADEPVARAMALNAPPLRHFLWDFDGTLMDTYPMMTDAFVRAAGSMSVRVDRERTLRLLKETLAHCVNIIAGENNLDGKALTAAFRREERMAEVTVIPGIPETLRAIRELGGHHYVVTHRDRAALEALRQAGLLALFDGFVTREDGFPRKPEPDMLLYLMRRHGLNPDECVMIGDRPLDTAAGRAAGMLSCLLDVEGRFPDDPCELRAASAEELVGLLCPEPL